MEVGSVVAANKGPYVPQKYFSLFGDFLKLGWRTLLCNINTLILIENYFP